MTETKFTPGPWTWGEDALWPPDAAVSGPVLGLCSEALAEDVMNGEDEWTCSPADRALIAAAPDLYEALGEQQRLIGFLSSCIRGGESLNEDDERWYEAQRDQAAAALAKARGET